MNLLTNASIAENFDMPVVCVAVAESVSVAIVVLFQVFAALIA